MFVCSIMHNSLLYLLVLFPAVDHLREEVIASHGVVEEYFAYDHM